MIYIQSKKFKISATYPREHAGLNAKTWSLKNVHASQTSRSMDSKYVLRFSVTRCKVASFRNGLLGTSRGHTSQMTHEVLFESWMHGQSRSNWKDRSCRGTCRKHKLVTLQMHREVFIENWTMYSEMTYNDNDYTVLLQVFVQFSGHRRSFTGYIIEKRVAIEKYWKLLIFLLQVEELAMDITNPSPRKL